MLFISTCRRSSLLHHFITRTTTTTTSLSLHSNLHRSPLSTHTSLPVSERLSSDSDDDPSSSSPSPSPSPSPLPTSLAVSYLVDSWGLSPTAATAVAAQVPMKDTFKSDLVLKFLKHHSFTATQIATMVRKRPDLVAANPRTRLVPKVEFFRRIGISGPDFAKVATSNPSVWSCRLDTVIMASVSFLKSVLGTDANVAFAIKRDPRLMHIKIDQKLAPNIQTLRSHYVPESRITWILMNHPRCLMHSIERFTTVVSDLKDFGYDPSAKMFVHALYVTCGMTNATWNKKVGVYRSFGWSDDEILMAFKRHPHFLLYSVERIRMVIGFLMGKLRLKPADIVKYSSLITFSLEKTIIPRCCVLNILILRGILSMESKICSKLKLEKPRFVKFYIAPYKDSIPEVLEAYEGKMQFEGFGL